jgi:polygalacturonase
MRPDPVCVSRREFVRWSGLAGLGLLASHRVAALQGFAVPPGSRMPDAWAEAATIVRRIVPPAFPARDVVLTRFGASGDGATDCTPAFRTAIDACHAAGGGRVVVPPGRFLTGPIRLKSRVNLHVAEGATILFDRDPARYLPVVFTRWEGVEVMNYSPLVYAFEERDVAITGNGTLDGQADDTHWWSWKGSAGAGPNQLKARAALFGMAARGVPVAERIFGDGSCLRPNFIQPYRCQNVLIEGVTILNSPMWEVHPVLCTNVTVRSLRIDTHGPNNDGCNPESCRDVLIENCTFDTGDDCIAIKSGRNEDGRRVGVPSENIVIRNCTMKDGHGGVVIGSEISGGARNVFAERCRMDSPRLDRALRIKTNSVRGGIVEHVYLRDVTVGEVAEAVVTIDYYYEEGDAGAFPPVVRDVEVRRVTSRKSQYVLLLRGYPQDPIEDVRIIGCRFDNVARPDVVQAVEGLVLENVTVNGRSRTLRRAPRPFGVWASRRVARQAGYSLSSSSAGQVPAHL